MQEEQLLDRPIQYLTPVFSPDSLVFNKWLNREPCYLFKILVSEYFTGEAAVGCQLQFAGWVIEKRGSVTFPFQGHVHLLQHPNTGRHIQHALHYSENKPNSL